MINEARTLLLNQSSAGRPQPGTLGEAIIDPTFLPVEDTPLLARMRAAFFGSNPDVQTTNFRLGQFLTLLEADPVSREIVNTYLDPRVEWRAAITSLPPPGVEVRVLEGLGNLQLSGGYSGEPGPGRHVRRVRITASDSSTGELIDHTANETRSITPADGFTLAPGLTAQVENGTYPYSAFVEITALPTMNLIDLAGKVPQDALEGLFESTEAPWDSIREMTRDRVVLRRFAGALLAVIFATKRERDA